MTQNVIESLSKTCDPNLNNADRRNHFMIVDQYQNELFQLHDLKTLLSPCLPQEVKIFGLKCLEHFILHKWHTADKDTGKSYLIEIIKEYGNFNSDANCERVMRWIISKSVMYFIRHECPQNCSTIINDLINLKSNGPMSQALILSIFYCLSEFLPIDTQMPDKRKKEVIGYLTENFNVIMDFCLDIIQPQTHIHSPGGDLQSEAVNTVQSFATWIKFDNLGLVVDRIFTVLINGLRVSTGDYAIFEVIETILDRKCRAEERYSVFTILTTNRANWHRLLANMKSAMHTDIHPYSDDKFRYLQKVVDLLLVMGNTIMNNWVKFSASGSGDSFDMFIDLIQLATHHPVKLLSIELLAFWYNGFKVDNDAFRSILVSKAVSLLSLLKYYSIKQSVRNPANVDHEYLVHLIEQQDEESYVNRIRLETSKAISTLTEYFTQDIVNLSLDMVSSIIVIIQQIKGNIGSSVNHLESMDHDVMKELEASRYFTRCVFHNIFRPYSKHLDEQIKNIVTTFSDDIIIKGKNIIRAILASENSTVHVISIYLDILCLLFPLATNEDALIQSILEKIFIWFNAVESIDVNCADYGLWRQLNKSCGVWVLRIFRDYSFLIRPSLFESILIYYQSICQKVYEHPIIIEAMTIYICHSSNYTVPRQEAILSQFIDPIKQVLLSDTCVAVFENGFSIIDYLHMNKPAPNNEMNLDYPSQAHHRFRNDVVQATNCLYGICCRLLSNDSESNVVKTKSLDPMSITGCPLKDYIMPLLPCLLKITRSLNQVWSSNMLHSDFSNLKEISVYYKDTLIKTNCTIERYQPNNTLSFGQLYVNNCRKFIFRLHDCIWLTLAKYCSNFSGHLYNLKEWHIGVREYVFTDLDALPNFKLTPLTKSFVIPFVSNCPVERCHEVIPCTIIPFINYMFGRLNEQWVNIKTVQFNDDIDCEIGFQEGAAGTDGDNELCNEIIEEQVLRILSKSFCELFKITMSIGTGSLDDYSKGTKLQVVTDQWFDSAANGNHPVMLMILSNLCHAITWKDSFCCSKLCQLIHPIVNEIHSRGFLTIDIVLFIFQQLVCALNIFADNFPDIKIVLLNLGVMLYDEHISKDVQCLSRFINLLNKSTDNSIQSFQNKMIGKINLKARRENLQTLLQPYIAVPTNQLFSQEVYIKDLPPLLKSHWKTKNEHQINIEYEEPLCLEDLFKH